MANYSPNVDSGSLRHKVRLYRKTTQKDGLGGSASVWVMVPPNPTWACIEAAGAYEVTTASQNGQQLTHNITMRFKSNIGVDMAIYWPLENRVFAITGIKREDPTRRRMTLNAMERRDLDTKGW